jgi:uncharacterized protein with FMN-binding domain
MPKRAIVALVTTALALVLLFSFKTPDAPARVAAGNGNGPPAATARPAGVTAAPTRPPTGQGGNGSSKASPTPASTKAPAGGLASGTVTGPEIDTRYGLVQVQVTIANGKVTDITATELPYDRSRSAEISQYAEPILRSEALTAQSAQIDLVSGATYTSIAYARSLQAALDQAHG